MFFAQFKNSFESLKSLVFAIIYLAISIRHKKAAHNLTKFISNGIKFRKDPNTLLVQFSNSKNKSGLSMFNFKLMI